MADLRLTVQDESVQAKFWARVQKRGPDECWEWEGMRNQDGYGRMYLAGRTRMATHIALAIAGRPLPKGMCACHVCDNPPCVNPAHLFIGSQGDNVRDMAAKGRIYRHKTPEQRRKLSESVHVAIQEGRWTIRRGSLATSTHLTEDDVRAIRASAASQRELARQYGVSQPAIYQIKSRKTWAHVI